MNDLEYKETFSVLSNLLGWSYFFAWSISFYPQVILNWRRRSVQGLSIDFVSYNVYGFLCYSLFNMAFFFSEEIRDEYKRRYKSESLVRFNDVMFATHAFLISLFTLLQASYYKRDSSQRLSKLTKYFICATLGSVAIALLLVWAQHIMWIDLLYYLSYIKLTISIIKYVPQAWLNYKRKSTIGWSIHNILLDFTGGLLSNIQLLLDAYISKDWSGVIGNPVKLGLGVQSMAFDILFMLQHYILYHQRTEEHLNTVDEERRRLIVDGQVPRVEDEDDEF